MLDKRFLEKYAKQNNIPIFSTRRLLTEYLQAEILQILAYSQFGSKMSFLGGTCLRFTYGIERFSEDLDFDLIVKEETNFQILADHFTKELKRRGFVVDVKLKRTENIFIIFVKFSQIMKGIGLSDMDNQKLKIKFEIDPNPLKNIHYHSEIISAYGKNFPLIVDDLPTLFAQKILAIVFRPYQKGRDFYDLIWFLSRKNIEPNYKLLREKKIKINNREELISFLEKQAEKSDLKQAAKDVEKFLFYPQQAQWILKLPEYLKSFRAV